jgi:hypothetical protein
LETVIILAVAIPLLLLTENVLARLHYLDRYLRVCAWCQKIDNNGEWVPIAQFFHLRFSADTSHGVCPECVPRIKEPSEKRKVD